MMKRYILTAIACVVLFSSAGAQQSKDPNIQNLIDHPSFRIGDQLPDFGNLKVINSVTPTIKLSDYRDKLLILDFWSTTCGTCIEQMPYMDALQKQFDNRIKIIPVTPQKREVVVPVWKTNGNLKNLALSSVVEAVDLSKYFTHRFDPHEVWVYKGKVIGITSHEYVDEYNINQVLSGKIPNWPVKNDYYSFDAKNNQLFPLDPKQIDTASTFIKYAAISDYKEVNGASGTVSGLPNSGTIRDPKRKTIRAYFVNEPIYLAYFRQLGKLVDVTKLSKPEVFTNHILWEVADRSKYKFVSGQGRYEGDWMRDHAICYESLNPDTGQTEQQVAQSTIADLNRLLGLNVRWEKRKEKVLALVRTTKEDKLKAKKTMSLGADGHAFGRYSEKGNMHRFRDNRLDAIPRYMNAEEDNPYVYDETGYEGNVDMDLVISSWRDIEGIRKALQFYDLDLKEEERLVDKFVFTEVNGGLLVDAKMIREAKDKRAAQKDMPVPTEEEGKAFLEANTDKANVVKLPSGLQYKVIKQGAGATPVWDKERKMFDQVKIHYTGMLVNGKIFDSSLERGEPLTRPIGAMIKGWQQALQLMPIGSKWEVYVPAELAYGEKASGPIPAGSALVFEIELLEIVK